MSRMSARRIGGYANPIEFYVAKITEGVATIAAAFWPKKVIVRLSDFKSNEYSNLVGGAHYEPHEENPMLGFRGASRYIAPEFYDCFQLECQALKRVRETWGSPMSRSWCRLLRTVTEAKEVIDLLARNDLERGSNGLRVIMMCEIPSNAILADRFLEHFDGFSIGSNDMTQLRSRSIATPGAPSHRHSTSAMMRSRRLLAMAIVACSQGGQVCRHLRARAVGSPGPRAMVGRAEDREHVAQPGHGAGNVAGPREEQPPVAITPHPFGSIDGLRGSCRPIAGMNEPVAPHVELQPSVHRECGRRCGRGCNLRTCCLAAGRPVAAGNCHNFSRCLWHCAQP